MRVDLRDTKNYTLHRFLPHGAIVIQSARPDYCSINATYDVPMNDSTGSFLLSQAVCRTAVERCDVST